jgi:phage terminase small subunit
LTKTCPICKHKFEGSQRKKYCSAKCKKNFENSLRSKPIAKPKKVKQKATKYIPALPSDNINRPQGLNQIAADFWDKLAPTLIQRGHLNILSEDAFAECCDLHSRLLDINHAINETNRSLLQIDDKWSVKDGETQTFKESALSDIKRKYSARFLEYCKEFYLTPKTNRGNYGLEEEVEKEKDEFFTD